MSFVVEEEGFMNHFDIYLPIVADVKFIESLFNNVIKVMLELRPERIYGIFVRKHCIFRDL